MKKPLALLLSLVVALSCGTGALEEELAAVRDERDALAQELSRAEAAATAREEYVASVSTVLNEITDRLALLRQDHLELVTLEVRGSERGIDRSDQRTVRSTMERVESLLAVNEEQIVLLEDSLNDREVTVFGLDEMVERLRAENDTLAQSMGTLRTRVAKLTTKVRTLETEVIVLEEEKVVKDQEIEAQASRVAAQEELIRQREVDLAIAEQERAVVYYVVGTAKELKDAGILQAGGMFGGKGKLNPDLKGLRKRFHRGDRRTLAQVGLGTLRRVIDVLPNRPEASYQLDPAEGEAVLKIANPAAFWQIQFLVVVVKR